MKKILLLSDTHGHIDERILKYAQEADEIWHAGDIGDLIVTDTLAQIKPLRSVHGNIDGSIARVRFPENNIFTVEGLKFLITHIGGPPGKYTSRVREVIDEIKPDCFYLRPFSHFKSSAY
jgi:putative phosphoesterase